MARRGRDHGELTACPDDDAWTSFFARSHPCVEDVDAHLATCGSCRALVLLLAHDECTTTEADVAIGTERSRTSLDASPRIGATIAGKWRIERHLGSGGMGSVYRARHRNGHAVAIKFLNAAGRARPEVLKRFRREAYVANTIPHPAIVKVLDDGEDDVHGPFLILELLDGVSCRKHIDTRGVFSPEEALRIASVVGRALGEAHCVGVVHSRRQTRQRLSYQYR